jgi:hypothetical protein
MPTRDPYSPEANRQRIIMLLLARLTLVPCLLLAVAAPAAAQRYDTAAGYGVGAITFGAFNPGTGAADLALQSGWVANLFGEGYTAGGHLGVRLNGAYTQRPLAVAGTTRNINTWMVDAGVVARPLPLSPTGAISPFITAGGGFINYGLGRSGRPVIIGEANVVYPGDDERQWTAVAGGGIDIVPRGFRFSDTQIGLRLEVADHMTIRSPFETVEGRRLGSIHNYRFGVSLVGLGWF